MISYQKKLMIKIEQTNPGNFFNAFFNSSSLTLKCSGSPDTGVLSMNVKARLAIMDILQTINTLRHFGEQTQNDIQLGSTVSLEEEEQLLLKGAFTLMRRTLDTLTPFVWSDTQHANTTAPEPAKKPALYLV
ncbi:hypothetical protein ACYZTX_29150 [Pseudomonas sp. MDT1-17]